MSESSERLEEEFAEIKRRFADHSQIAIVSTDGSPVNQYVVEYRLNGLVQLDDSEIVQSDQHRIEISLSFGFPHFPPNCRPLTKIFHPDMDPSAIKIAEFWTDSTSLAELIVQIGKMICWQVYSSENGFNQAALDWLAANDGTVPMDTVQGDDSVVNTGLSAEMPELSLDLLDDDASGNIDSGLDLSVNSGDQSEPSFVDDLDFNFAPPEDTPPEDTVAGEIEFSFTDSNALSGNDSEEDVLASEESEPAALDLGAGKADENGVDSSFVDDLDFNFESSSSDDSPLELCLENEDIKPVNQESFSFVVGEDDSDEDASLEKDTDIVVEKVAIEEPDYSPSFPVDESDDVDLDLAVVDVDYDILKGMIDQRNYIAAHDKLSNMSVVNISKASAALQTLVGQRIEQADGIHGQAVKLENDGLLEDAANKLEAVMNLVQDYRNIEVDMKRVRDAWAGIVPSSVPDSNLSLERSESAGGVEVQSHDSMLTKTVVTSAETVGSKVATGVSKKKKSTSIPVKQDKGDSFLKQKQNKPLVFAAVGLLLALCLSGWVFVEWQAFSKADEKWGGINSLLEKNEYQKVQDECVDIRSLLSRVKIIMGGGKKELLDRVDGLLKSEHFLEGLEGKILWQGEYISKKAHRAYIDIAELVEEAERRGALSKWQESADLYLRAFKIAEDNKQRLNVTFFDALAQDVKKAKFANLVSLGKKYFIGLHWVKAIENFEAALSLASQDGVADPSTSYDVNRYLQRAWFSQYVIDGDDALGADDYKTSAEKYTKAYAIAKDPNLIDDQSRNDVLIKLNQSSLIKIMDDANGYVKGRQWNAAVKSYTQAKKYTMDGYPLIETSVVDSQKRVEGLLLSAIVGMERAFVASKRVVKQYVEMEDAYGRILKAIDQSSLRDQASIQKIRRKTVASKDAVHMQAIVDSKIEYLSKNYRQIVAENFTNVSLKALSNIHIEFLGREERALNFKIQCREHRESKYYTLELIYQYDLDLDQWGFPEMR